MYSREDLRAQFEAPYLQARKEYQRDARRKVKQAFLYGGQAGVNQEITRIASELPSNIERSRLAADLVRSNAFRIPSTKETTAKLQGYQTSEFVPQSQQVAGDKTQVAQRASMLLQLAGLGSQAAAGTAMAAVMGPLAIGMFAVQAFSRIQSAKRQRKAIKKAMQAEVNLQKQRNVLFQNRMRLEDMALVDTMNQVERQALKRRATFNVVKGETLSGATYNMLQTAMRRNELEYKERLKSRNIQNRIALRENQVEKYYASRVKIESLAAQNPSNSDIALGILSDGMSAAMNYYQAVGPSIPEAETSDN